MMRMQVRTRVLLGTVAATTAFAGFRYACYPNQDNAVEAAYYLGVSAKTGNVDARARLDRLFPNDRGAQIAFEHGLESPTCLRPAAAIEMETRRSSSPSRHPPKSPLIRVSRRPETGARPQETAAYSRVIEGVDLTNAGLRPAAEAGSHPDQNLDTSPDLTLDISANAMFSIVAAHLSA